MWQTQSELYHGILLIRHSKSLKERNSFLKVYSRKSNTKKGILRVTTYKHWQLFRLLVHKFVVFVHNFFSLKFFKTS